MRLISVIRRFFAKYYGSDLDFRVRLFNLLASVGTTISIFRAITGIPDGLPVVAAGLGCAAAAAGLMAWATKSKRYALCYSITIIVIFLTLFPALFLTIGGYRGNGGYTFMLALVFTVILLEGRKALLVALGELLIYVILMYVSWRCPQFVRQYATERENLVNLIRGLVINGGALSLAVWSIMRIYNLQQKKLDEQNKILARSNRAKTEFLSNSSHEMRTPLTVASVNVQTVIAILEDGGNPADLDEAKRLLQSAQNEIMRLSRMVGGLLHLSAMSENTDRRRMDLSALLIGIADAFRLYLGKKGNTLEIAVDGELCVFGNADLLAQVLSNLLQNAGEHTKDGKITLTAKRVGEEILIAVRDTGTGISPERLPHVFERGVSEGGTGFGLPLSKVVVEAHGGKIWLESEIGAGTKAFVSLPVYGGQFGGMKN
jgi:signal transduction histidine kinase